MMDVFWACLRPKAKQTAETHVRAGGTNCCQTPDSTVEAPLNKEHNDAPSSQQAPIQGRCTSSGLGDEPIDRPCSKPEAQKDGSHKRHLLQAKAGHVDKCLVQQEYRKSKQDDHEQHRRQSCCSSSSKPEQRSSEGGWQMLLLPIHGDNTQSTPASAYASTALMNNGADRSVGPSICSSTECSSTPSGTAELGSGLPSLQSDIVVKLLSEAGRPMLDGSYAPRATAGMLQLELNSLSPLGRGGCGVVYRAEWRGAPVAVKFIVSKSAEKLQLSVQEAVMNRILAHPNVVHTYTAVVVPVEATWLEKPSVPEEDSHHMRSILDEDEAVAQMLGEEAAGIISSAVHSADDTFAYSLLMKEAHAPTYLEPDAVNTEEVMVRIQAEAAAASLALPPISELTKLTDSPRHAQQHHPMESTCDTDVHLATDWANSTIGMSQAYLSTQSAASNLVEVAGEGPGEGAVSSPSLGAVEGAVASPSLGTAEGAVPSTTQGAVERPHSSVSVDFSFNNSFSNKEPLGFMEVLRSLNLSSGSYVTCIVMEHCDRGSLATAIKKGLFQPSDKWGMGTAMRALVRTSKEVAQGLAFLHANGICHADLKPANVLLKSSRLDRRGFTARLSDFGYANISGAEEAEHMGMGTVAYMAPEALDSKKTTASDVWSYGVLLYEMCTGLQPYAGLHWAQVMGMLTSGTLELEWPSSVQPVLRKLGMACMNYDPSKRPTTYVLSKVLNKMEDAMRQGSRPSGTGSSSPLYNSGAGSGSALRRPGSPPRRSLPGSSGRLGGLSGLGSSSMRRGASTGNHGAPTTVLSSSTLRSMPSGAYSSMCSSYSASPVNTTIGVVSAAGGEHRSHLNPAVAPPREWGAATVAAKLPPLGPAAGSVQLPFGARVLMEEGGAGGIGAAEACGRPISPRSTLAPHASSGSSSVVSRLGGSSTPGTPQTSGKSLLTVVAMAAAAAGDVAAAEHVQQVMEGALDGSGQPQPLYDGA